MVKAVRRRGVFSTDINDGVTSCKEGRVARAEEERGSVGWVEAEQVDSEGFVSVECTTRRENIRGREVKGFRGRLREVLLHKRQKRENVPMRPNKWRRSFLSFSCYFRSHKHKTTQHSLVN